MARAAAMASLELRGDLSDLATVAATAPLLGMLATVLGIMDCFGRGTGEKSTIIPALMSGLSIALVPAACSLLLAVPAFAGYQYLRSRVETFDMEMHNASLDLLNRLGSHPR